MTPALPGYEPYQRHHREYDEEETAAAMQRFTVKYIAELILVLYAGLFLLVKKPYLEWDRVINSDGKAYYAYLTTLFIYHDWDYTYVEDYEASYYPADRSSFKEFRETFRGETVNKAFPGPAVLWLPFFLLAHVLSLLFGFPADGYSILYQYAIGLASLFYLWLGCRLLYQVLMRYTNQESLSALAIFLIAFGTNVIYYTLVEGSMAHINSFFLLTLFLYSLHRTAERMNVKWAVYAALSFGLILITRPTNGIFILLLPFIAGSRKDFTGLLRSFIRNHKAVFFSLLSFVLMLFIPLALYYIQTGYFFVYSYGKEGFDFSHPHLAQVLFSFDRGWFVYTPIALVAMLGFIPLFRTNRFRFWILILLLGIHLYIASCWWVWNYASKFGQRVFIDFYAVVAILLVILLGSLKGIKMKTVIKSLLAFLFLVNILQFYQHWKWVFPVGKITREVYADSFTRLIPKAQVNIDPEQIAGRQEVLISFEDTMGLINQNMITRDSLTTTNGSRVSRVRPYSVEYRDSYLHRFSSGKGIIRVTADVWTNRKHSDAALVIEFQSLYFTYSHNPLYLDAYNRPGKWITLQHAVYIPENPVSAGDYVKVFFADNDTADITLVDNLRIEYLSVAESEGKLDGVNTADSRILSREHVFNDMEKDAGWGNSNTLTTGKAFSGSVSCLVNRGREFGLAYEGPYSAAPAGSILLIRLASRVYCDSIVEGARQVADFRSGDQSYRYVDLYPGKKVTPGFWSPVEFVFEAPEAKGPGDKLLVYWYNPSGTEKVYIDDMEIEFISLKK
jgi:hypothetical protein